MKLKMRILMLFMLCINSASSYHPSKYVARYITVSKEVRVEVGSKDTFQPYDYVLRNAHPLLESEYEQFDIMSDVDVEKVGEYQVRYNDRLQLDVIVEDTIAPTLQLHDLKLKQHEAFTWNDDRYTTIIEILSDNYTSTEELKASLNCDPIDTSVVGNKQVNCYVVDEFGNQELAQLSLQVRGNTPRVSLSKNDQGTQIPPAAYTSSEIAQIQEVAHRVNQIRSERGVAPLRLNMGDFHNVTYLRTKEVVSKYSHIRENGLMCHTIFEEYGLKFNSSGENIAMGQQTPEEVVNDWMNSPTHRDNILRSEFTILCVGVSGSGDAKVWTQEFF